MKTVVADDYWYENRDQLREGLIFRTRQGDLVKLDRSVPGDGTKWIVAEWLDGWAHYDSTIEPGDLIGDPIDNTPEAIARVYA